MKRIRNTKEDVQGRIASIPGRHCPYVSNPFKECFIANINSQNINEAIYYCGNNFEECEVYRSADNTGTRVNVRILNK